MSFDFQFARVYLSVNASVTSLTISWFAFLHLWLKFLGPSFSSLWLSQSFNLWIILSFLVFHGKELLQISYPLRHHTCKSWWYMIYRKVSVFLELDPWTLVISNSIRWCTSNIAIPKASRVFCHHLPKYFWDMKLPTCLPIQYALNYKIN